ncbi:MAG: DUF2786 domain-containing protein [Proteobacteria bacterium]|nr:DUF2786 domain-containing protein [Pseudomonadota bacterium]
MSDHMDKNAVYAHLLRRISVEYEHIFTSYKLKRHHIVPATLRLSSSRQYLGQWHPQKREISLSLDLCCRYRWCEVLEALKHEIAHQIVDEYLSQQQSGVSSIPPPPHGKLFVKACDMICVAPWARSARIHADAAAPSLSELLSEKESPIEQKISKLLRLSESSNEHEAALALERVKALAEKFSITHHKDGSQVADEQNIHFIALPTGRRRRQAFHSALADLLITHFGVQGIFTKAYDVKKHCDVVELEVIGKPRDLLMAEYVYHYLIKTCDHLWLQHKKNASKDFSKVRSMQVAKNSFIAGVLGGFREKLKKTSSSMSSSTTAKASASSLSIRDQYLASQNTLLSDFFHKRYPYTHKVVSCRQVDKSQYKAGKQQGRKLSITTPLAGGHGAIKLLN